MKFIVVNLATNEPERLAHNKALLLFDDGTMAAEHARQLTAQLGVKYQPRPHIEDANAWRTREAQRIADGTYSPLVWADESWFKDSEIARDHFAHVSREHLDKIAYTESPEKGAADIQTRIRPGRYLQRYFESVLDAEQILFWAESHVRQYERHGVIITQDADEIARVYRMGPHSCMKGDDSDWDSEFHPARVYAGPDLGVAYVESDGRPTARCVVWPEKKIYSVIYGDSSRLLPALQDIGYKRGYLSGARVRRYRDGGHFVMPYVDGCDRATDEGDFIRLDDDGDISTQMTNGLSGECDPDWRCDRCNDGMDDCDSQYYIGDANETWCESCHDRNAYVCAATGEAYRYESNVVRLEDGTIWSQSHFDNYGHGCEECGALHRADDIETVDDEEGDSHDLCATCAEEMRDRIGESRRIEDERQIELELDPDAASRPAGYLVPDSGYWRVARYDNATGRHMEDCNFGHGLVTQDRSEADRLAESLTAKYGDVWRYLVEAAPAPRVYVVRRYSCRDGRYEGPTLIHPAGAMNPVTETADESLARRTAREMMQQHGAQCMYSVEFVDAVPMRSESVSSILADGAHPRIYERTGIYFVPQTERQIA